MPQQLAVVLLRRRLEGAGQSTRHILDLFYNETLPHCMNFYSAHVLLL